MLRNIDIDNVSKLFTFLAVVVAAMNWTSRGPAYAVDIAWDSSTGAQQWLAGSNWIGGSYPGETNNSASTNTDVATFSNSTANLTAQIDSSPAAANGQFALGAIVVNNSVGSSAYTIARTGTGTLALTLNGATVNSIPNTIFANFSTSGTGAGASNLTVQNDATSIRLGNTANVVQVVAGRTVSVGTVVISERSAGSNLTVTGGGTFTSTASNTYSGVVTVSAGSTFNTGTNAVGLGISSTAASNVVLNNGTVNVQSGSTGRLFTLAGNGTISATTTNTMNVTNTGALAVTAVADRTLTLNAGALSGSIAFSPQIVDGADGKTSVTTSSLSPGVVRLNAANTYTGATTVSAGTLALGPTGSFAGSPSIRLAVASAKLNVASVTGGANHDGTRFALASGQTLSGIGSVVGAMDVGAGATIAPGNSIGTLGAQNVSFTSINSALAADIDFSGSGAADLLMLAGTLTLTNSTLNLSFTGAPAFLAPTTFMLVNNDGSDAITGTFGIWTNPIGYAVTVNHAFTGNDSLGRTGDGNDLAVTIKSLAAVPEPGTVIVWAIMLASICLAAKRCEALSAAGYPLGG